MRGGLMVIEWVRWGQQSFNIRGPIGNKKNGPSLYIHVKMEEDFFFPLQEENSIAYVPIEMRVDKRSAGERDGLL